MAAGILALYRWPHGTELAEAPEVVQRGLGDSSVTRSQTYELLCIRVGKQAGTEEDIRSAVGSIAFMILYVSFNNLAMVDVLDQSFQGHCLACRYGETKGITHARSAVAWRRDLHEPVDLAPQPPAVTTLITLIESCMQSAPVILKAMLDSANALTDSMKHADKTTR